MDFDLNNILLGIIAVALSVIAIKITFSFNINEYLKSKDEKLKGKIRNYCTHANMKEIDGQIGIESSFISPSGTVNWICQKCGLQMYSINQEDENKRLEYLIKNFKEFKKQEKKFKKLIKKAGYL